MFHLYAISVSAGECSVYDTPPMTGQTMATGGAVGGVNGSNNTLIHQPAVGQPAGEAVPVYNHHTHAQQRPPPIVVEVRE